MSKSLRFHGWSATRSLRSLFLTTALLASAAPALLVSGEARAADLPIAVEVTQPPENIGIDASVLRATAEGEIRQIDASKLSRRVVVSFALSRAAVEGPFACTVNAMLRDAKTGVMIAIIEAGAQAEGPASPELRKQVAHAAVRSAVRRIPRALGAK